jgi:polyphosphate kinase
MGFCTPADHQRFLSTCPLIEKQTVDSGIILIKLWLEVGMKEQERRFKARIEDPLRQWKLSPMDIESFRRWYDYSKARDLLLQFTNNQGRAMARRPLRRQAPRPAQRHLTYPEDDPV